VTLAGSYEFLLTRLPGTGGIDSNVSELWPSGLTMVSVSLRGTIGAGGGALTGAAGGVTVGAAGGASSGTPEEAPPAAGGVAAAAGASDFGSDFDGFGVAASAFAGAQVGWTSRR
jgi:hypothetical protein